MELVNGKRTTDPAYSPEELWKWGYFYALTNVFGSTGTEVWIDDLVDGRVIGIEHEIP